jgi:hypothetical protein
MTECIPCIDTREIVRRKAGESWKTHNVIKYIIDFFVPSFKRCQYYFVIEISCSS